MVSINLLHHPKNFRSVDWSLGYFWVILKIRNKGTRIERNRTDLVDFANCNWLFWIIHNLCPLRNPTNAYQQNITKLGKTDGSIEQLQEYLRDTSTLEKCLERWHCSFFKNIDSEKLLTNTVTDIIMFRAQQQGLPREDLTSGDPHMVWKLRRRKVSLNLKLDINADEISCPDAVSFGNRVYQHQLKATEFRHSRE